MDAILLVLWIQMSVVVAIDLWGSIIVKMVFWFFFVEFIIIEYLNLFLYATLACLDICIVFCA